MRALAVSLLAASSLFLTIATTPAIESQPMRTLVYSFERSIDRDVAVDAQPSPQGWQQQAEAKNKTNPRESQQYVVSGEAVPQNAGDAMEASEGGAASLSPGGGTQRDSAANSGTIEVDVLREQGDGGLVVSVREQVKGAAPTPATCVVYPNTSLTCDSQQSVNPEEYALLRFLGKGFVDPSQMDAQRRWHVAQSGAGLDSTADYQIVDNAQGALTIAETQTIASKGRTAATIRSTIGYDFNRSLPTSIDERLVQNQQSAQSAVRAVHTVLKLVSVTP